MAKEVNSSLNQVAAIQDAEEAVKISLQNFVNDYQTTLNSEACTDDAVCDTARQNFDSTPFVLNSDTATVVSI